MPRLSLRVLALLLCVQCLHIARAPLDLIAHAQDDSDDSGGGSGSDTSDSDGSSGSDTSDNSGQSDDSQDENPDQNQNPDQSQDQAPVQLQPETPVSAPPPAMLQGGVEENEQANPPTSTDNPAPDDDTDTRAPAGPPSTYDAPPGEPAENSEAAPPEDPAIEAPSQTAPDEVEPPPEPAENSDVAPRDDPDTGKPAEPYEAPPDEPPENPDATAPQQNATGGGEGQPDGQTRNPPAEPPDPGAIPPPGSGGAQAPATGDTTNDETPPPNANPADRDDGESQIPPLQDDATVDENATSDETPSETAPPEQDPASTAGPPSTSDATTDEDRPGEPRQEGGPPPAPADEYDTSPADGQKLQGNATVNENPPADESAPADQSDTDNNGPPLQGSATTGEAPSANETPPSDEAAPDQQDGNAGGQPLQGSATTDEAPSGNEAPQGDQPAPDQDENNAGGQPLQGGVTTDEARPAEATPQNGPPVPDQLDPNTGSGPVPPPSEGGPPDSGAIPPPSTFVEQPSFAPANLAQQPSQTDRIPTNEPPARSPLQAYAEKTDLDAGLTPGQSAAVDQIMDNLNQLAAAIQQGGQNALYATNRFFRGMTDFLLETGAFLNQPAHVPALRIAQAIQTYLTRDAYNNNAALLASAQNAVAEFQKDPAYFSGKNAINAVLLVHGAASELAAMRAQVSQEVAAGAATALSAEASGNLAKLEAASNEFISGTGGFGGSHDPGPPPLTRPGPASPTNVYQPPPPGGPAPRIYRPSSRLRNNPLAENTNCAYASIAGALRRMGVRVFSAEDVRLPGQAASLGAKAAVTDGQAVDLLREYLGRRPLNGSNIQSMAQLNHEFGIPQQASEGAIVQELANAPVGSGGLVFSDGHVFGVEKLPDGRLNYWDDQQGLDSIARNMDASGNPIPGSFSNNLDQGAAPYFNYYLGQNRMFFYRYR